MDPEPGQQCWAELRSRTGTQTWEGKTEQRNASDEREAVRLEATLAGQREGIRQGTGDTQNLPSGGPHL